MNLGNNDSITILENSLVVRGGTVKTSLLGCRMGEGCRGLDSRVFNCDLTHKKTVEWEGLKLVLI